MSTDAGTSKPSGSANQGENWKNAHSIYEFSASDINGKDTSLEKYKDKVLLVVNVACKCGLTNNNYKQLQAVYTKLASKGLAIAAFPSNQFMGQEPWKEEEIQKYVNDTFGVQFDLFSKIDVNGANAHPIYKWLKQKQPGTFGDFIKWNFSKFLINQKGEAVGRYGPDVDPEKIVPDIEKLLAQQPAAPS